MSVSWFQLLAGSQVSLYLCETLCSSTSRSPLIQTCRQAQSTWSSTAWTATRTQCWGSSPGTNQPSTGPTRTVLPSWVSTPRSAVRIRLSRRSGPSLWAFLYRWPRRRAGSTSVTLASRNWFSRKLESATVHHLDVNLSFPCTRHSAEATDFELSYNRSAPLSGEWYDLVRNWIQLQNMSESIWCSYFLAEPLETPGGEGWGGRGGGGAARCVRQRLFLRGKGFLFFGVFW